MTRLEAINKICVSMKAHGVPSSYREADSMVYKCFAEKKPQRYIMPNGTSVNVDVDGSGWKVWWNPAGLWNWMENAASYPPKGNKLLLLT